MNQERSELRQAIILSHRLGIRILYRRAVGILCLGIFMSTLISAALGFFAHNTQHALNQDVAQFLGAPLVIRSTKPLPEKWWPESSQLSTTQTTSFTTGAIGPGGYQSISLKGVSNNYPLQGQLVIEKNQTESKVVAMKPKYGEAWLDQRAMDTLSAYPGDDIQIGQARFTVTARLVFEPDRLTQLQHILPRVMVSMDAFKSVGLSLNSGRGEFRYLFKGNKAELSVIENMLPRLITEDYEILKPTEGNHPFARMNQRVGRFLGMVSVLVIILCGSAAAILANYIVRHYRMPTAVLRCLGAERRAVTWSLLILLGIISLVCGIFGSVTGWLVQPILFKLLQPHLNLTEAIFSFTPAVISMGVTLLIMLSFVLPRMLALNGISVITALRNTPQRTKTNLKSYIFAALSTGLMLWIYTDNVQLTGILAIGIICVTFMAVVLGLGLSKFASQIQYISRGWLRVVMRSIGRSPSQHMTTIATISLAVMTFLVTMTFRGSFLDTYHSQRLTHDGNYLFSELPYQHLDDFQQAVEHSAAQNKGAYPVVHAYLSTINKIPIEQAISNESDTREETRSSVRLSWSEQLPENNTLIQGQWPKSGSNEVSVDAEVMSDLGLSIGDELGFLVNQTYFTTRISSTRGFKGGGSSVMFWFMFAPDTLSDFKQSYMGGIQINHYKKQVLATLIERFPMLRITELDRQLKRIRSIMIAITRVFDSLMMMILAAALVVILAVATNSSELRSKQTALLRCMGVSRNRLKLMFMIEHSCLGLVAGAVGIIAANIVIALIYRYQFALPYRFNHWIYILIPWVSALCFVLIAYTFGRNGMKKPPIKMLQQI